jgi:small subunit ribosomal protein S13
LARIAGVDLPREKRSEIALTYIYGIGRSTAQKILRAANIDFDAKIKNLTGEEVNRLRQIIETQHKIEGELRQEVANNIKLLMDIGSYRGMRHRRGLPTRGQRTHTNARTRKGRKRAMGEKKKLKGKKK